MLSHNKNHSTISKQQLTSLAINIYIKKASCPVSWSSHLHFILQKIVIEHVQKTKQHSNIMSTNEINQKING